MDRTSTLSGFVAGWSGRRVTVLGDLVADVTLMGTTSRISREAPVLVVLEQKKLVYPGGGANVVANLRALGAVPLPVGIVGRDEPGQGLIENLQSRGIPCEGVISDPLRFTTTKTRIFAGGHNTVRQQMLRLDRVNRAAVTGQVLEALKAALRRCVAESGALLVSDYGEGVVHPSLREEVCELARQGVPVFVDSRFAIHQFFGVTALTPNEPELAEVSHSDLSAELALDEAGQWLLQQTRCESLLVKRGRNGMALFLAGKPVVKIPAYGTVEVADVTGAGDTVLASFSLARIAGASAEQAMHIANTAGGIKVTKSGTAVVSADELCSALEKLP